MKNFMILIFSIIAIFQAPSQVFGQSKTELAEKDCLPGYRLMGKN